MRTKLKIIYESPEEVMPEMERAVERAYAVIFEAVIRERQLRGIKSKIIKNENEYAKSK